MTREELKRKYDDISDRQKEQLHKFIQEKEELFNTYKNDENCPFRVGDFYVSKVNGKIVRIRSVEIYMDGYIDDVDYSEFEIYFEDTNGRYCANGRADLIMSRYIKTDEAQIDEKKEKERLLHEMAIEQTRKWKEAQKFESSPYYYHELWELGYKQALRDLKKQII